MSFKGDKMYAHGYLMFPDYIAIGMLIGNVIFLISLIVYAIRNISGLDKELAKSRISEERIQLKIHSSLLEGLSRDFQLS